MIPRRVWINLAAFLGLFAVLSNWAVRNVLRLDVVERPYAISAAFTTSPGLRPNQEVTYLGVRVGTIDAVALVDGHVRVDMDVDRGMRLPRGLSAAVRRKSAIGEPYVALEAPVGYRGDGPFIDPSERYAIPVEATSIPLSYGELFRSLGELVAAVPPDALHTVVHEMAVALEGRGDELRRLIVNSEDVTATFAARTDLLDQLATELTAVVDAVSADPAAVAASFDNLAALTDTLAAAGDDLAALLDRAPGFAHQLADLLDASVANLACAFADSGALFGAVGTPQHVADFISVLQSAAAARDALDAALVETGEDGADGPYLGGGFTPGSPGEPPPVYDPRPPFPEAPPLEGCDAPAGVGSGGAGSEVSAGPAAAAPGPGVPPAVPPRPPVARGERPPSSPELFGRDGFSVLAVLVALLAMLAALVAWRGLPQRARRLLAGFGRRDGV